MIEMTVRLHRNPMSDCTEIYIFSEVNGKRIAYKPVALEEQEIKEGTVIEPTLKISGEYDREFIEAFRDGINEVYGEQAQTSELKATKYHLEDLRKLLKLDKKSS